MKILAVGDLIGSAGIRKLKSVLPELRKKEGIDFVIVNGENSAEGMGMTEKNFKEILEEKVDVITMGNHTWGKKDIFKFIDHPKLIRPANYTKGVVGKGYNIYSCKDKKIAVINLIGRVDMNVLSENPFVIVKEIIENIQKEVDIIIIDFHAEATAEKIALGYYLDGKVTAVYGTHTHVQTADETILERGTAYITDIGMTGPKKSVIGMDVLASRPQLDGKVGSILSLLNDEEQAAALIAPPAEQSESILLGEDLEPQIPGLCIVSDRYLVGGGLWGSVALIGPTRMPFQKLMPLLHYFADQLGEGMSGKRKDTPQAAAPRRTVIYKEDLE